MSVEFDIPSRAEALATRATPGITKRQIDFLTDLIALQEKYGIVIGSSYAYEEDWITDSTAPHAALEVPGHDPESLMEFLNLCMQKERALRNPSQRQRPGCAVQTPDPQMYTLMMADGARKIHLGGKGREPITPLCKAKLPIKDQRRGDTWMTRDHGWSWSGPNGLCFTCFTEAARAAGIGVADASKAAIGVSLAPALSTTDAQLNEER